MDLQDIWKDFQPKTDEVRDITNTNQLHNSSNFENPLKKLKKLLKANIIWSIVISLIYVPALIYVEYWQIHAFLSVVIIFTIWAVYSAFKLYQDLDPNISSNNLLSELKRQANAITKWMKVQKKVALAVYPISAAAGFMFGAVVSSGKPLEQVMAKPNMIWILIATVVVLTPLCHFLTKSMFNYSFGKVLKKMNGLIDELSEEK